MLIIRLARPNELKIIHSYLYQVQQEATLGYVQNSPMPSDTNFNGESYYFVLIHNGALCGWILLGETVMPHTNEFLGVILELYVLPVYRKNGYGEKLMHYAMSHFYRNGVNKIQLNVYEGNAAESLYKKLGFKKISSIMEKKM